MKVFATLGATSAALMLFGAAATAESLEASRVDHLNDARLGEQVDRICFRDQINDFREPTEATVIVERGVKDYLVQTEEACDELDGAQTVSINGAYAGGRCVTTSDRVAASQSAFGGSSSDAGYLCRIKAIYEWNEDALEKEVASID